MYAVLKNTLIAASAAGMFSLITLSGSKTGRLLPENNQAGGGVNPFPIVTVKDTPPSNNDLHYPLQDNGYGEPVYNNKAPLQLNDPSNVKTTTTYDPKDKTYNFDQKMGTLDYRKPTYMTEEEYKDYQFAQQVKSYWKSRIQADSKSDPKKKQLIPKLTVGGELFDRLFGGNTVDIRPTGSAELMFGVITNRNQNPAIPVKQRKISNPDFNMKIQMNIVGKIGEKLKLTTNYNTEASFDFENQMKIEYNGTEDEILKKIEAGNVSLPLNSSLIQGSQTLFGVKTQMQFGKLTATTVFSQQRGKKTELNVQNGAQTVPYTVQADNYEANRHYFLGQFFRDNYNHWLVSRPLVNSPIQITKIEVYVTNRTSNFTDQRNIAGFADLGEDTSHIFYDNKHNSTAYNIVDSTHFTSRPNPRNTVTNLYHNLTDSTTHGIIADRNINTAVQKLTATVYANPITGAQEQVFNAGRDFEVLTRARRLNPTTDYYLNPRLGYISLNTSLNYDEVLSVSYQYTYNGHVYQVGEFSDQFPSTDKLLVTKLLKSTQVNTQIPMWDLMMKNVYSLGAYSLSQTNFALNVYYNNLKTGVDIPYIPYGTLNGKLLIQVMGLDTINQNSDPHPDGYYDFIPNVTVNPQNGRVYFTTVEPFGNDLRNRFHNPDVPAEYEQFIFQELYDSVKTIAQQLPNKDRFKLKGSYQSATSNEFSLNAMNIPQGSVRVSAGGINLTENVDYTVDYTLGRVKIINESVLNSGQPIKITAENNSLFNVQQKSLIGTRLDYKQSKDFALGATVLHMSERPLTQKVNMGDEPVSNTMLGIDYNYRANAPWLTRLVDKLPLLQTKEPSSIQLSGEGADLIVGHAAAIGANHGTSYIDDFEGSVSTIDLRTAGSWVHASIPQGQPNLFPEASVANNDSSYITGLNRAKMAWYTIDQSVFYQQTSGLTPPQVTKTIQSNHFMEPFYESDLFPKKTPPNGQPQLLPSLDLAFYPDERGPYNFDAIPTATSKGIDVSATNTKGRIVLNKPETRWGGIMRSLSTNDFQSSNIEYIQFWMMDPFNEDYNNQLQHQYNTFGVAPPTNGELYFNLGNVSEDILHDGSMSYENGLPSPTNPNYQTASTVWGRYPTTSPLVNAFDNNPDARPYQDAGYDGLANTNAFPNGDNEVTHFSDYTNTLTSLGVSGISAFTDPAGDDYHFYRGDDYDKRAEANTLFRYKEFNNSEGNSPTQSQYAGQNSGGYSTISSTSPNIEDMNRDNTMAQAESYYQYKIKVTPQDINPNNVGNNYIVNVIPVSKAGPDGVQRTVNFYQFKIPITNYDQKIGSIEGFNSIRFMRMFSRNFSDPVVMRFMRLELVRSDWRVYNENLGTPSGGLATDNNTEFDVSAVSYQENGTRTPVNYVLPPGINQQQNVQTTNQVLLNEQSLSLRVKNLKDGDARATYKNIGNDIRSYKKLRMFVHAEKLENLPLNDGEMHMFIRLGSDFTNNYYQYEVPLKLTAPHGTSIYDNGNDNDRAIVWPNENEVIIDLEQLPITKLDRLKAAHDSSSAYVDGRLTDSYGHTVSVVGEPNIAAVTSVMIGIYNPPTPTNPKSLSAEVWVDELRVTDFNQHGGQAAISKVTAKLADFGQVSLSGQITTPFFGAIDAKPSDRSRATIKQYAFTGTFQMAKFLPAEWKVNLPMYLAYSEIFNTPQYDPSNPDLLMSQITTANGFSDDSHSARGNEIQHIKNRAIDYTRQRGINFTNVSKQRGKNKTKMFPWDIENFSATYAFNEQYKTNINTEHSHNRSYNAGLNYNYTANIKSIEPFKNSNSGFFKSPYASIIKDLSIKPVPSQYSFSTAFTRTYIEILNRDITASATESSLTQTQYNKTFNVSRNYSTRWDITKNIKADFTATNLGRILEPTYGKIETQGQKDTLRQRILAGGTNTSYQQNTNLNVTLPLNKIPALDFISQASYKYSGNYQWIRRPFIGGADSIGNSIQNAQTQGYSTQFNMVNLYNKIPFFKRVNLDIRKVPKKDKKKEKPADPNAPKVPGQQTKPQKPDSVTKTTPEIFFHLARIIMSVKQLGVNYNITQGTTLPGFQPTSYLLGNNTFTNAQGQNSLAPGLGFAFGANQGNFNNIPLSSGITKDATQNGWLVQHQNFSTQYLHTKTQTLNYNAKIEPFKNFKVDLTGQRTYGQNQSYFIGYNDTSKANHGYTASTLVQGGTFNVSVITIGTSFRHEDKKTHNSEVFDNFLALRSQYQEVLAGAHQAATGVDKQQSLTGYNRNQQDVVIGSFVSAYTGAKISSKTVTNPFSRIPLPGWNLTYDGLGKIPAVKKIFKSVVITHAYRSSLNYGTFSNNQAFTGGTSAFSNARVDLTDPNSNFVSKNVMNVVTVSEQFAPLVKFNFMFIDKGKMKGLGANFEVKRDRTVSLASNIPQVNETHGSEYNIGATYTYPNIEIKRIKVRGKPLKSDLQSTLTLSFRQNQNIIRKAQTDASGADTQFSQLSSGQNIITIKSSFTYAITQNINLRFYYDRTINRPVISTSFPTQTTNAGVSVRFVIQ